MAVDTRNKRDSVIAIGLPWRMRLPAPDGTLDQADRQHICLLYSGILAGAPVVGNEAFIFLTGNVQRNVLIVGAIQRNVAATGNVQRTVELTADARANS